MGLDPRLLFLAELFLHEFVVGDAEAVGLGAIGPARLVVRATFGTGFGFRRDFCAAVRAVFRRHVQSMFEKSFSVAQATRLCRPATRRTEWEQRFKPMRTAFSPGCSPQIPVGGSPTGAGESPALPILMTRSQMLTTGTSCVQHYGSNRAR